MAPVPEIRIDDEVLARLPGLKLTGLAFEGARMGVASRKIEPLRDRVIASARQRIEIARDPRRIPQIAAYHRAFPELARGSRRLWIDDALRAIARRDPFPVQNDAVDAARLLALHYAVPVSAHDLAKVAPPVALRVAPPGTMVKTAAGTMIDAGSLPVLCDAGGPIGSPVFEVFRTAPGRQAEEILYVIYDAGTEEPIDAEDVKARAGNWLATLTGARPAR